MCQRCIDAVKRHWPDLPEVDYHRLLWNCTAFPVAPPEVIEQQVREMAEKSGCDLDKAIVIADMELSEAMTHASVENDE